MAIKTCRVLLPLLALSLPCPPSRAQQGIDEPVLFRVHPNVVFQTMAGFGAGFCETTLKDIQPLTDEGRTRFYDLLYGEDGVRLNIIRFHISWKARPLAAEDPLRARGLLYDWEHDAHTQDVRRAMEPALKLGRRILYAVPFSPPVAWKSNKQDNWGGRVSPEYYRDYAEYLADFVSYYQNVLGVRIDVLSLQNEPDVAVYWTSCRWSGDELRDFLKVIAPAFKARGLDGTKFMLSEGSDWDQAWMRVAPALDDAQARGFIGVLASHSYGGDDQVGQGRGLFREASLRYGIPVWMSEMSIIGPPDDKSMNAALRIAGLMYRDIVQGGAQAWIYCFTIFTPEFSGSMGVLSPVGKNKELIVPKRFWAMANYSRFIGPGWKRIEIEGLGFANTAFASPDGDRFAIVALNAGGNVRPARYDFGDRGLSSLEAHCTAPDRNLSSIPVSAAGPHAFEMKLPPRSITTMVGKMAIQ
jgi:O-glycosyl hydrolase